jgi:hypothetical protein
MTFFNLSPSSLSAKVTFTLLPVFTSSGELVAQFKFTVIVTGSGCIRVSGGQPVVPCKSEHSVQDEELKALLSSSASKNRRRKAKKAEESKPETA